jgi:hypothetical protein
MKPMLYWLSVWIFGGLAAPLWAGPSPLNAEELLSQLEARAAQLRDYRVNVQTRFRGQMIHVKYYFKQPNLVRVDAPLGQVTVQPDGEIRGRAGKGLLGKDAETIDRSDHRLRDAEGTPFWDTYFSAALARIRAQVRSGASATVTVKQDAPTLEVRSGPAVWTYTVDPDTLFFREIDRAENGKQVESVRYSSFQPNVGLDTRFFQF